MMMITNRPNIITLRVSASIIPLAPFQNPAFFKARDEARLVIFGQGIADVCRLAD
jgi:hypothetical protein